MNTSYTNRKLVLAYPTLFNTQAGLDIVIPTNLIDGRHPQTTPTFHGVVPFREEFRDCGGEYVYIEKLNGKLARFTIGFDATALFLAGWFAYLQGVSATPTGTPANETQTFTFGGATSGSAKLNFDFEGLSGTTAALNFDATNAQILTALESLRPIKAGNVSISGTTTKTITFIGALANANVPLLTVSDDTTAGGTGAAIAAGTAGANKLHSISRTTTGKPVKFSLIEGFEGEADGTKKYKNLCTNDITIGFTRGGKVTVTIVAYGSAYPETLTGYSMPACSNFDPLLARDCRMKIGSNWIGGDLRELQFTENNNIDISEDVIKWDGFDIDELELGDRTSQITATILGSPTSDLYELAEVEDTAFAAFQLAFGRPGERLTVYAPNTQFRLEDGLIQFVGNKNKSAFAINGRPSPDGSGIVTRGEYHGAHTQQFLLTS